MIETLRDWQKLKTKMMVVQGKNYKLVKKVLPYLKPVAEINNLSHVEKNIFKDPEGRKFYLDRYGYHSVITLGTHAQQEKESELKKRERNVRHIEHLDRLGVRSKKKLMKILNREELPDHEKLRLIRNHLDGANSNN